MTGSSTVRRGYVLQPTYRIFDGRPVVHLFGRLEDGSNFLITDDRQRPHFYVVRDAAEAALDAGAVRTVESEFVSMHGASLARVEAHVPGDVPAIRDRLHAQGRQTFEADVRFAMRYLIDRGIRGSIDILSEPLPRADGLVRFENPEVCAGDWSIQPRVLSVDIETDVRTGAVISIALDGCGASDVLIDTRETRLPDGVQALPSEARLLDRFAERVRELDPDVITGWNVIDFDLSVLIQRAERNRVPLELGKVTGATRVRRMASGGSSAASIPGRVVLDGLQLLRGAFIKMERYGLDFVAREVVGLGKTLTGPDRAEDIYRLHENDPAELARYNLNDARLVNQILDELNLIDLTVQRSRLTGMPLDRVSSAIASIDFLYLSALGERKIAAPTARSVEGVELGGGTVLQPEPGLYEHVLVLDFSSLYPSIIRTFHIDPLNLTQTDSDSLEAPNGARFRREPGILPVLLDDLIPRRVAAKRSNQLVASQAIKILMNSFYGVLGTSACRLFDPQLANAITSFGREILLETKNLIESKGYDVIYGDTDSLFVQAGTSSENEAENIGKHLVKELNIELKDWVERRWAVVSRLELEFEKLYLKLLLPAVRHGVSGARKRYAGLVRAGDETDVVFTGMESVRRDWTKLAKRVQHELYRRLFRDEGVEDFLREIVAELRAGRLDAELTYRKALRKPLAEYTANTPPHVAAARKMKNKPGRLIAYVITTQGPEPVDERVHEPDYEHYVEKQVRPVAEPVLAVIGLSFRQIVGDGRQQRLF